MKVPSPEQINEAAIMTRIKPAHPRSAIGEKKPLGCELILIGNCDGEFISIGFSGLKSERLSDRAQHFDLEPESATF